MLSRLDQQFAAGGEQESISHPPRQPESIYYHRDLLCHSVEGRRVDLLTVSSHHGITEEEDCRLEGLFPDQSMQRAKKFTGKKVGSEGFVASLINDVVEAHAKALN